MASFSVEINQRANKDGLHTIFIRIIDKRKIRRVKLDFRIKEDHFNKDARWSKWIRTSDPKHKQLNRKIEDRINELRERFEILEKENRNALLLVTTKQQDADSISIREYFDKYLLDLRSDTTVGYYVSQVSKLNRFAAYFGDTTPIAQIGTDQAAEYKRFLLSRSLAGSTVNDNLVKIHRVFKLAAKERIISFNPFTDIGAVKSVDANRSRLSDEQIQKLSDFDIPYGRSKGGHRQVRDYYLFSYYNAGIRVADFMQLRYANLIDGRLVYEMDKTGHKKSIKLSPLALSILDKYIRAGAKPSDYLFPILSDDAPYAKYITFEEKRRMPWDIRVILQSRVKNRTKKINESLKALSSLLKFDVPLTFHTARHSFADKARRAMKTSNKIQMMDIKNMMAHKRFDTTEKYMNSFDVDSLDEAMGSIFE